jgi:hypothetical protein
MGATEIMPIFQAGPATHAEVMNSLRLFGRYVIPHFRAKDKGQPARASVASNAP